MGPTVQCRYFLLGDTVAPFVSQLSDWVERGLRVSPHVEVKGVRVVTGFL